MYGAFSAATLGMSAQASALSVISTNVANVNTGGYKQDVSHFMILLGDSTTTPESAGGIGTWTAQTVDRQGTLSATGDALDVAINGGGLFVLETAGGDTVYGRDGSFSMEMEDGSGYLVDKNGHRLMGWPSDGEGGFVESLSALRIDPDAWATDAEQTTNALLAVNLPNDSETNESHTFAVDMWDSGGTRRTVEATFTKSATPGEWTLSFDTGDASDTVNTPATTLTFDELGTLVTPESVTIDVAWGGGSTSSVALDLSEVVQFASDPTVLRRSSNGFGASELTSVSFDAEGNLVGSFDDDTTRVLAKVPLARFANVNGLDALNGNVWAEGATSGEAEIFDVATTDFANFMPATLELSNVDIEEQFSRMILAQNAYSASSTAFKAVDEMTEIARDLKG